MSALSRWRVIARLSAVFVLAVVSAGQVAARTEPQLRIGVPESAPVINVLPHTETGPFGLRVARHSALSARWRRLQPVIRVETQVLALCRADRQYCPPAAARFLAIIEAAEARTGLARIGEINRAVNLAIRPMSDEAQFGVPDVWTTPLMTFASRAGDCEDYAIAKLVALRQTGMAARDLRLVVLHDRRLNQDHAVVAARLGGRWLILDNRTMFMLADSQVRSATPLLALATGMERPERATSAVRDSRPRLAAKLIVTLAGIPAIALPRHYGGSTVGRLTKNEITQIKLTVAPRAAAA